MEPIQLAVFILILLVVESIEQVGLTRKVEEIIDLLSREKSFRITIGQEQLAPRLAHT